MAKDIGQMCKFKSSKIAARLVAEIMDCGSADEMLDVAMDGFAYLMTCELRSFARDIESEYNIELFGAPEDETADSRVPSRQSRFRVILTSIGHEKNRVAYVVRAARGGGLASAKKLVESRSPVIKGGLTIKEAEGLKREIEQAGGTAHIK